MDLKKSIIEKIWVNHRQDYKFTIFYFQIKNRKNIISLVINNNDDVKYFKYSIYSRNEKIKEKLYKYSNQYSEKQLFEAYFDQNFIEIFEKLSDYDDEEKSFASDQCKRVFESILKEILSWKNL